MDTKSLLPIFMVCNRDAETHEYTFNSYVRYVYDHFATPILFFNSSPDEASNEKVRRQIAEGFGDKPYILHENRIEHNYWNIQLASHDCLRYAERYARRLASRWNYLRFRKPVIYTGVMFCEDDITFSNLLMDALRDYNLPSDASLLTLYQPEHGYRLHERGRIDWEVFYGTQSCIFPLDSLRKICYNETCRKAVEGYDRVWVKTLAEQGLKPYALDASYIQHNQIASLLSNYARSHSSSVFRFNLDTV